MFLDINDYKVVIGDSAMNVASQASAENRANAEAQAQELISSYLRPVYDVDAIFGASGDSRNRLVVMYMADIALYNMCCSLPGRLAIDIRKQRYDNALAWLQGVSAGKIVPDIPHAASSDGSVASPLVFGSDVKQRNNW
jgi:phage gp36-like protein